MAEITQIIDELVDFSSSSPVSFLTKQTAALIRKRRLQAAADVLQRKMSRGRPWLFRDDEVASLTFDFLRAAEVGTANHNLLLLADLIANGAAEPGFTESEVRHLMRTVEALSYEELRALAALIRGVEKFGLRASMGNLAPSFVYAAFFEACRELSGGKFDGTHVPREITYTFAALMRTGLVISGSIYQGFHGTDQLLRLASLAEAGSFPGLD